MDTTDTAISERIERVKSEIADAAREAARSDSEIRLLAVSKKQPLERVRAAYDAGLRDFGENYLQGLQEHTSGMPDDVRWHFIGHVQSKKAKHLAGVALVHSVDSIKVARLIGVAAADCGRTVDCLLSINISNEDSKSGLHPDELPTMLDACADLAGVRITGLMCIPSPAEDARAAFARLRQLRDHVAKGSDFELRELSMGMSDSYREAIAEGSTIVRVGTAIFGPRES